MKNSVDLEKFWPRKFKFSEMESNLFDISVEVLEKGR